MIIIIIIINHKSSVKESLRFLDKGHLANIYLFKFNSGDTRKRYEICSKLTIKTSERRP